MSGGGSGGSQTTEVSIPKEFNPFLFKPSREASGFVGDMGDPGGILPRAENMLNAGTLSPKTVFGDVTQEAQQNFLDVARGAGGVIDPAQQAFGNLLSFDSLTDPRTEAVAQAATRPIEQQLERVALPGVADAAIGAGQFGGSRQGVAEAVLRNEAAKSMGDIRSNIFFSALQNDLARQERAIPLAGQLLGLQQIPGQLLSQVGGQQDIPLQEEANLDQRNLFDFARLLQGFIPGASQTTTSQGGGLSTGQKVGGGLLAGAGIGAQAGTVFGLPGMAAGAGLGALGGLLL